MRRSTTARGPRRSCCGAAGQGSGRCFARPHDRLRGPCTTEAGHRSGPGNVLSFDQSRLTFTVCEAGRYRIATSWSPYWRVPAAASNGTQDGMTVLDAPGQDGHDAVHAEAGWALATLQDARSELRALGACLPGQSAAAPSAPHTSSSTGESLTKSEPRELPGTQSSRGGAAYVSRWRRSAARPSTQRRTACHDAVAPAQPHVKTASQVVGEAGRPAADRGRHVARPAQAGVDRPRGRAFPTRIAFGVKQTSRSKGVMSANDAVDGAHSTASMCQRVVALKRTTMRGAVHGRG